MNKKGIIYRMIDVKKAERNNLSVAIQCLTEEIEVLVDIHNAWEREGERKG